MSTEQHGPTGTEGVPDEVDGSAIVPVGEQTNNVEVLFHSSFAFFFFEQPFAFFGMVVLNMD